MSLDLYRRLRDQMQEGELKLVAASLAFSTVLSMIPFIAVSLALLKKFGGMTSTFDQVKAWVLSNFSDTVGNDGVRLLNGALEKMVSAKLGTVGAILLILTSTRLIADMEVGINRVWNAKNDRSFLQRLSFYWVLILIIPFGMALTVAASSASQYLGPDVVHFGILFISLTIVYKIVPVPHVLLSSSIIGSLVGTIITFSVHKVFIWAAHTIFNYRKLYGSIAAIPIFLFWILLIWYGILIGAVVSAAMESHLGRKSYRQ